MNAQLLAKKQKAFDNYNAGNFDVAAKQIRQVCQKAKNDPESWMLLGVLSLSNEKYTSAEKAFARVIEIGSDNEFQQGATINLGALLCERNKYKESISVLEKIVSPELDNASVYINLANAYLNVNDAEKARKYAEKGAALAPSEVTAHIALATACSLLKDYDVAEVAYKNAIDIDVRSVDFLMDYALKLQKLHEYARCITICSKVLGYQPDSVRARVAIFECKVENGCQREGLSEFRGLIDSGRVGVLDIGTYLLYMQYDNIMDPNDIVKYHAAWGEEFSKSMPVINRQFEKSSKKLNIGYVSADFRTHSVAYYIEAVLKNYTRSEFEVYCFSSVKTPDETTKRIRKNIDHWVNVFEMTDSEIAKAVVSRNIDILVDLSGHTHRTRLHDFSKRLAPVQITWLGYPATTGLPEMDYRLVDFYTDPDGYEEYSTEKLIRIPECFLCYFNEVDPPEDQRLIEKSDENDIVFCSFNNISKVNVDVVSLWSKLLSAVSGSKLLIKSIRFESDEVREHYLKTFSDFGVTSFQLELVGHIEKMEDHLRLYERCDVALDTFPYNGTTTTCEAMWMGVPVVTLCGDRHSARVGNSLLHAIGQEDWVAHNEDEYIKIASDLAADKDRLKKIKSGLRKQMQKSVLCDGPGFTAKLEKIYRDLYQRTFS